MNKASLILGSNINKEENIVAAITALREHCAVLCISKIYETAPIGTKHPEIFFNAAVQIQTTLNQKELKEQLIRPIESKLGRLRTTDKNAPRTIDIDIALFFHNERLQYHDKDILKFAHITLPLAELHPDLYITKKEKLKELSKTIDQSSIYKSMSIEELQKCHVQH